MGKGKSLIAFASNYIVLDIETTGLDYRYDNIIEIAAIKVKDNEIIDTFSSLLKPEAPKTKYTDNGCITYYVDKYIEDLTGITNEMIENAPETKIILEKFKDFVGDDIVVGHNVASFDIRFLKENFKHYINYTFDNQYIDTLRLARWILKDLSHHRLTDLLEFYKIQAENLHRAENDCIATIKVYNSLKLSTIEKHGNIEAFIDFVNTQKNKPSNKLKSCDIEATTTEFDIEHPFYKKCCVFTGALEKMSRKEAMLCVKNVGGDVGDNLTKKTNYLIVGDFDYIKSVKEGKSRKMIKAEEYKKLGIDIEIISESTFYSLLDD